jgi:hypothetical protein
MLAFQDLLAGRTSQADFAKRNDFAAQSTLPG